MYEKKNDYIAVVIVLFICIAAGWLYTDSHRNDRIHNNTGVVLDTIEVRVDDAGKRIDAVSDRVSEVEKTVSTVTGTITDSRKSAEEIASGIADCEKRLDSITQRQGRITNLVADIEAEYQKRKSRTQAADMAK